MFNQNELRVESGELGVQDNSTVSLQLKKELAVRSQELAFCLDV
jgi:hypothetical protein